MILCDIAICESHTEIVVALKYKYYYTLHEIRYMEQYI